MERKEELSRIRFEIAISLCATYPHVYQKATTNKCVILEEKEAVAYNMLLKLFELEPKLHEKLKIWTVK